MKSRIFSLLCLFAIATSCQKSSNSGISQPDVVLDKSKFTTLDQDNYSIQYPNDWLIEKDVTGEVAFFLYFDTARSEDEIGENINLMVQNVSSNLTLDQYTKISLDDINRQGSVISSEKIITPSKEYQRVVCTMKMYNEDLKFIQHYIVKDAKVYVLTFTSMERNFSKFEKSAEQVMQSFSVK
jgi:hypothetical protein